MSAERKTKLPRNATPEREPLDLEAIRVVCGIDKPCDCCSICQLIAEVEALRERNARLEKVALAAGSHAFLFSITPPPTSAEGRDSLLRDERKTLARLNAALAELDTEKKP